MSRERSDSVVSRYLLLFVRMHRTQVQTKNEIGRGSRVKKDNIKGCCAIINRYNDTCRMLKLCYEFYALRAVGCTRMKYGSSLHSHSLDDSDSSSTINVNVETDRDDDQSLRRLRLSKVAISAARCPWSAISVWTSITTA